MSLKFRSQHCNTLGSLLMVIVRNVACAAWAFFSAATLHAGIRVTDVDGHEVRIDRGRAVVTRAVAAKHRWRGSVTVDAGPDVDLATNDFRRIQNAINAVVSGDAILLNGTFDFTAPFAAAAWALGNDNAAGTADDYSVLVPPGLGFVTLTATTLGTATIQGPGDLAAVNLEGFLVFDGGDNPGWMISKLRILDFDLGIGMFAGAGGVDAFDGTEISDNFIRIPTDLNATIAPADTLQNIGLHYAFGINQQIINNQFEVAGNGVSADANASASVGVQSNSSSGMTYNGLSISRNSLRVQQAASGAPETLIGFWENGQAHASNIVIADNDFINDGPGNFAVLNLQRAFRVSSHSGAASTVRYVGNQIAGSNIGLQWIAGFNFAGNLAVRLEENLLDECTTGVLLQSSGVAHLTDNSILRSGSGGGVHVVTGTLDGIGPMGVSMLRNTVANGTGDGILIEAGAGNIAPFSENIFSGNTGFGVRNNSAPLILAEYNWWGSNLAPEVAAEVSGNVDYDPWRLTPYGLFADGFE